jgi:hypothetical protein
VFAIGSRLLVGKRQTAERFSRRSNRGGAA